MIVFFFFTTNSPICLPLRGRVCVPSPESGWAGDCSTNWSMAEEMPCDFWGYHHKRPDSFRLVSWKACSLSALSLSLLEPSHHSVSSPSHMERPCVSTPVNSLSWANLPSPPSPGKDMWMKKPPDNSSPQPLESPWLFEPFLLSSQASWSRDKPDPLC